MEQKNSEERHPRILIVEDETLVSWSLSNALRKRGIPSIVVDSGEKAIEILRSSHVDLVLTDLKLPHIDGLEVASESKRLYPRTPVIAMSANDDRVDCIPVPSDVRIDRFIEKPFDLFEVIRLIEVMVSTGSSATKSPV